MYPQQTATPSCLTSPVRPPPATSASARCPKCPPPRSPGPDPGQLWARRACRAGRPLASGLRPQRALMPGCPGQDMGLGHRDSFDGCWAPGQAGAQHSVMRASCQDAQGAAGSSPGIGCWSASTPCVCCHAQLAQAGAGIVDVPSVEAETSRSAALWSAKLIRVRQKRL